VKRQKRLILEMNAQAQNPIWVKLKDEVAAWRGKRPR
jgi:hypothetical protein